MTTSVVRRLKNWLDQYLNPGVSEVYVGVGIGLGLLASFYAARHVANHGLPLYTNFARRDPSGILNSGPAHAVVASATVAAAGVGTAAGWPLLVAHGVGTQVRQASNKY